MKFVFQSEVLDMKLSQRTVEDVCELITRATEIAPETASKYTGIIRSNNISGKVLLHCDLTELKSVSYTIQFYSKP